MAMCVSHFGFASRLQRDGCNMTTDDRLDDLEILGLEVRRYKNLREIWFPWSDGVALFGVNGAGKTNLLECLALLMGTDQTINLAQPRLAIPGPDDLAFIARPGKKSLPWPPNVVMMQQAARQKIAEHPSEFPPELSRLLSDGDWWRMFGATGGADFSAGLASAGLADGVLAFVSDLARRPVVRYGLTHVTATSGRTQRTFSRTLMSSLLPDDLAAVADRLPDAFAPMRSYLAASQTHPGGWVPVLELPPTHQAPAAVQWLPRARTTDEVNVDLESAFQSASAPAELLAETLAELPLSSPPQGADWHWWLHKVGQTYGEAELELTLPAVSISASGGYDADFLLSTAGGDGPVALAHTGQDNVLELFSAGERRWVDEALATMARELTRLGRRAELYAGVFDDLDENTVMAAIVDVASDVEASIRFNGYWTEEVFDLLLQALEPSLVSAAHAQHQQEHNVVLREAMIQLRPELLAIEPSLVIRVFDEPEAHLHPTAQRAVALAIDRVRNRGDHVVIASHSPHFLDLPSWSQVHVQRSAEGTTLVPIAPDSNLARSALAAQLGINRGELLAGITGILLVEGKHDQIVLQRLYGSQLRASGLAVVRMHGTDNLMATAELDFLDQYLDVPVIVLLDYTQVDRVLSGQPVTDEEHKLLHLRRSLKRRNRTFQFVGLERPDIVCYLSESALREQYPHFPGWSLVLRDFKDRRSRPKFKDWLRDRFDTDLTQSRHIEQVLDHMHDRGHQPVGELSRKVSEILSHLPGPLDHAPE